MGRIGSGLAGAVLGLIVFACTCTAARWNAAAEVPGGRIDELCQRVVALRICGERQVMGVFDYRDVPEPIRREAMDRVEAMDRAEKFGIWALSPSGKGSEAGESQHNAQRNRLVESAPAQ